MADVQFTEDTAAPFKPHRWSNPATDAALLHGAPVMAFVDQVRDIATGVGSILELLGDDDSRRTLGAVLTLDDYTREALSRLAIQASALLADRAESLTDWAYERHTAEGGGRLHVPPVQ